MIMTQQEHQAPSRNKSGVPLRRGIVIFPSYQRRTIP